MNSKYLKLVYNIYMIGNKIDNNRKNFKHELKSEDLFYKNYLY